MQVFSYGYCEIFKNTHFEDRLWMAASGHCIVRLISGLFLVRINFQQNCSLQLTWILEGTITVKKTSEILKKVGEFSRNKF